MNLISQALSPNVQEAVRRARSRGQIRRGEDHAVFGVGGIGCGTRDPYPPTQPPGSTRCPPPSVEIPGCVRPGRTCDSNQIGQNQVVAGGSPFTITVEPDKTPFFQPKGVRATVTDLSNSDLNHRVLFTGVSINGFPQEGIHDTDPTAPVAAGETINGWWSDVWEDPDRYAMPVGWGYIGTDAQKLVLQIHGIALGLPEETLALVGISIVGNPLQELPKGLNAKMACQPCENHTAA